MDRRNLSSLIRHWIEAPHRIFLLTGIAVLCAATGAWTTQLALGRAPAGAVHAGGLLFGGFLPAMLGFLFTVFPRWLGAPALAARAYAPAATLCAVAGLLWIVGLAAPVMAFAAALASAAAAAVAASRLAAVLRAAPGATGRWHPRWLVGTIAIAAVSSLLYAAGVMREDATPVRAALVLGVWGFLVPTVYAVGHRMLPFFTRMVVPEHDARPPPAFLVVAGLGFGLAIAGEIGGVPALAGAGSALLCALFLHQGWRGWHRGILRAPLLWTLHLAWLWGAVGCAIHALGAFGVPAGRAATHALALGLAASMLAALGSRVVRGHEGQPLELDRAGLAAFFALQAAAAARVFAEWVPGTPHLTLLTASGVLAGAGLLLWLLRHGPMLSRPQVAS